MEQEMKHDLEQKNAVMLKSNIIKNTMGFDEFPVDKNNGVSYNLKLDGSKMNDDIPYNFEKKELEYFISDLCEIEKHCNITGVNIKNINITSKANLQNLANIVKKVKRVNIDNSNIPGLKNMILHIENKNNMELINIKNSGINAEDIDKNKFENIYSFIIENNKMVPTIKVTFPWYRNLWNKMKKWPVIRDF